MGEMEPSAAPAGEGGGERGVSCPWCGSGEVEKVAEFGPHLMVSQYICRDCRNPFEAIRKK